VVGAAAVISVWAQKKRDLSIGHTGLTWIPLGGRPGAGPVGNPMTSPQYVDAAIRDISSLGFAGIELFGNQIEAMEAHGGIGTLLQQHNLELISAYCGTNLTDPDQRKDSLGKTLSWARLVRKYGGRVVVIGPNSMRIRRISSPRSMKRGRRSPIWGLRRCSTSTPAPAWNRAMRPMR